ncbi:MAG TPA: hypothetical protein DCZ04_05080, partial [Syntrophorhabdus aromaticivorans]|nr:hypothetical protein [Syntrophorhabdus aromaticivorans]
MGAGRLSHHVCRHHSPVGNRDYPIRGIRHPRKKVLQMEKRISKAYPSVREVTEHERVGMVKDIFSTITSRYDFLNHFLSLRRDIAWRRFTVKKMRFPRTRRFLDIACGTGDLAIEAVHRHREIRVHGVDFVQAMID